MMKTAIQTVFVVLFFISVITSLIVLMTSHAHQDLLVQDLDLSALPLDSHVEPWDLSQYDTQDEARRSKLKALGLLTDCIMKKSADSKTNNGLPARFVSPSYRQLVIPPGLDESIISSFQLTVHSELARLKSVFSFLSQPVINKHNFEYIHNPKDACLKRKIDLVIAVPSAPEHTESRQKTRQGLKGSYSLIKSNNATLVFFLGKSNHQNKSRKVQVDINMEMRMHGDIVQESFVDVYRNLTLKSMSVLKWVDRFCPHAQFVIKADDDVGIKPTVAVSALKRYRGKFGNYILGRWNPMVEVMRNKEAKIYISYEEYPHSTFSPHLLGGAMGFPATTARLLYQAALRLKPIWLDDVFLSAICAQKVNVPVFMDAGFDFMHKEW